MDTYQYIRRFANLQRNDVATVGGKNSSLGEMIRMLSNEGIRVPDGFATTADAYRAFVQANKLEEIIASNITAWRAEKMTLADGGSSIRRAFRAGTMPDPIIQELQAAYAELSANYDEQATDVAVRSSATAEDLPEASFAGQQETFLNIRGFSDLLDACVRCFASLFTDRAIAYRERLGFDHSLVALSIGVQKMIRSDLAGAGVMFTIDTETGFPNTIVLNAAWGLGENVVKGTVTPDEYLVFKPLLDDPGKTPLLGKTIGSKEKRMIYAGDGRTVKNIDTPGNDRERSVLSNQEIVELARWGKRIEEHYGTPMDIEWAKDGRDGLMYIVQARPETIHSRRSGNSLANVIIINAPNPIVEGISVGRGIASGSVRIIAGREDMHTFKSGDVLVAGMTDPDWVPLMRQAAAIVTDQGGRTCHAAIVARELGVPAIVGTTNATQILRDEQHITVACSIGSTGAVYAGDVDYETEEIDLANLPDTRTKVMLNIGSPDAAFSWWQLPADGIGLARMEFLISNRIKIHPMALLYPERVPEDDIRQEIAVLTRGYPDGATYFVERLASGIAQIAASQYPRPTIIRTSDFKTNEYAGLIGGRVFEPQEENPMLGFRGASRYYHERYREGFALECRAIKKVREEMGLGNVIVMIPFCRTLAEADRVLEVMADAGLKRGENGLHIYVMCEIPSNVLLADQFAERFDGFSIGSNDLTQLVLGVDRDSAMLADLFDERDEAVKAMIRMVIEKAHAAGRSVGICGQAPSDHEGFAEFLVESGIDSMSLTPDRFVDVKSRVARAEKKH